jgi:hypothetical protein
MRPFRFVFAAGLLAAGCAHAQQFRTPAPAFEGSPWLGAIAIALHPIDGFYLRDESHQPILLQDDWRSDPRFVVGINLNRHLALEGGFLERFDRGYHKIDPFDPMDARGIVGARGYHAYAGAKLTAPLTDKLTASGTLGLAYSERRVVNMAGIPVSDIDVGAYAKVGAEYKPTGNTSISGSVQNFGASSAKWGRNGTNANALKGAVGLKF